MALDRQVRRAAGEIRDQDHQALRLHGNNARSVLDAVRVLDHCRVRSQFGLGNAIRGLGRALGELPAQVGDGERRHRSRGVQACGRHDRDVALVSLGWQCGQRKAGQRRGGGLGQTDLVARPGHSSA